MAKGDIQFKTLYKAIYNAARAKCLSGFENDVEHIKMAREAACVAVTTRTRVTAISDYKKLRHQELKQVLLYLQKGELPASEFPVKSYATESQKKKLRQIAIECALIYCDFSGCNIVNKTTGEIISGEPARNMARTDWNSRVLTGTLYKHMHSEWVHPKMHTMLQEGSFRYISGLPKTLYYFKWDELLFDEAIYLIQRFQKIHNESVARNADSAAMRKIFSLN